MRSSQFPSGSIQYGSNGNATGYGDLEAVWNEGANPKTGVGAGGGGISIVFERPYYQSAIPTCAMLGSLPDSAIPIETVTGMARAPPSIVKSPL